VLIRAELATASARLGPKRAADTLLGAQKRLGTAEKFTINGRIVPSHPTLTLDNPLTIAPAMGWGGGWVAVAERRGQWEGL
jgi:hypothetical protein